MFSNTGHLHTTGIFAICFSEKDLNIENEISGSLNRTIKDKALFQIFQA